MFLLLDIDNTLYEFCETHFNAEMHDAIIKFAQEVMGFSYEKAVSSSFEYHQSYGLTLHGFHKHYRINAREFSDRIHQCSYDKLKYNASLVAMLSRLKGCGVEQKMSEGDTGKNLCSGEDMQVVKATEGDRRRGHYLYYFTNASRSHARRVLEPLGLKPVFTRSPQHASPLLEWHRVDDPNGFEDGVEWVGFGYEDQWRFTEPNIANKPMRGAYEMVYRALEEDIRREEALLEVSPSLTYPPISSNVVDDGEGSECDSLSNQIGDRGDLGKQGVKNGVKRDRNILRNQRACLKPDNIVMVDDSLANLDVPLELGWKAVWRAHSDLTLPNKELYQRALEKGSLKIIHSILELERVLDEWEEEANA